jgi:ABC-type polysaccharide/polyol phosphate export permease
MPCVRFERVSDLATIAEVWQRHELIGNLVGREIRARYKQSVLGVAWSLITPLVSTVLSTFIFSFVAGFQATKTASGHVVPYMLFVYVGTMFWGFFVACINSGADSMTSNLQLLTKVYIPREVFPLASILGRSVDFLFSLVPFVFFIIFFGVTQGFRIPATALLVPFVLVIQLILILGLSLLFSTMNLFYRDVRFLLGLVMQVWAILTPVSYPISKVLSHAHKFPLGVYLYMHLNPMTPLVLAYQSLILGQTPPADLGVLLLSSLLVSIVFLVLGYSVFRKYEGSFAEAV